jgi:hypothetical protein
MADQPTAPRPVRVWPAVALAFVYWIHQLYVRNATEMACYRLRGP